MEFKSERLMGGTMRASAVTEKEEHPTPPARLAHNGANIHPNQAITSRPNQTGDIIREGQHAGKVIVNLSNGMSTTVDDAVNAGLMQRNLDGTYSEPGMHGSQPSSTPQSQPGPSGQHQPPTPPQNPYGLSIPVKGGEQQTNDDNGISQDNATVDLSPEATQAVNEMHSMCGQEILGGLVARYAAGTLADADLRQAAMASGMHDDTVANNFGIVEKNMIEQATQVISKSHAMPEAVMDWIQNEAPRHEVANAIMKHFYSGDLSGYQELAEKFNAVGGFEPTKEILEANGYTVSYAQDGRMLVTNPDEGYYEVDASIIEWRPNRK